MSVTIAGASSPALGLDRVEAAIGQALADQSAWVTQVAGHTAFAGGKRLRPTLCLLAGEFGKPQRQERVVRVAAGLELIHLASLIHDDVVDKAETRRDRPTVGAVWGNPIAVLAGDYLFATSFGLLYSHGSPAVVRLAARMIRELSAGAIDEARMAGSFSPALEPYYERIYRKTAVFLETACKAGAVAGGAPPAIADALGNFGRRLGYAFQISDDLLDFTGDPAVTGKPVGGDLKAGITTLPMILGYQNEAARPLLANSFGDPAADVSEVAVALAQCGALARARQVARTMAEEAKGYLALLTGLGPTAALAELADRAACRDR